MVAKGDLMDVCVNQVQTHGRCLPRQGVYGQTSLESSLTAMGEIEERVGDAVANRRRLLAIKDTATQELEALQLLKRVDEARSKLASLKNGNSADEEAQAEIRQLEDFIAANSRQAEQAITERLKKRTERTNGARASS